MIEIKLKLKHRNPNRRLLRRDKIDPPEGTWVWMATRYLAHVDRKGDKQKEMQGTGHRRRAYGPFDTFTSAKKGGKR